MVAQNTSRVPSPGAPVGWGPSRAHGWFWTQASSLGLLPVRRPSGGRVTYRPEWPRDPGQRESAAHPGSKVEELDPTPWLGQWEGSRRSCGTGDVVITIFGEMQSPQMITLNASLRGQRRLVGGEHLKQSRRSTSSLGGDYSRDGWASKVCPLLPSPSLVSLHPVHNSQESTPRRQLEKVRTCRLTWSGHLPDTGPGAQAG